MTVSLPLYPSFLQTRFFSTREVLEGHLLRVELPQVKELSVTPKTVEKKRPVFHKISFPVTFSLKPVLASRVIQLSLGLVIVLAVGIAVSLAAPALYYRVFPAESRPVVTTEQGTPMGGEFAAGTQAVPSATPRPLPPQDASLPTGTWLIIPRIGIRTEPMATENSEEALEKGVWQVPGYGIPGDTAQPLILAAHRYGWQWWWKTDYWKYHSFYSLPDLQPGDVVEVIHDQRKYYYEVYAGEEGEEITDYSADMILYTCKFLNSPLRHFRYARLVDPAKNTQALTPTS